MAQMHGRKIAESWPILNEYTRGEDVIQRSGHECRVANDACGEERRVMAEIPRRGI